MASPDAAEQHEYDEMVAPQMRRRRMAGAMGGKLVDPLDLFAAYGAAGLYIPSFGDFSRLFQDSAGTIPVTQIGDPIGKVIDAGPNAVSITQATAGSRGVVQQVGGRFVWRGDGLAHCLFTDFAPGTAQTYIVAVMFNADLDCAIGARTGSTSTRSQLMTAGDGSLRLAGGVGATAPTTMTGGSSVQGIPGVAALRYNASAASLFWLPQDGPLSPLYGPSTPSGTPNTTIPVCIGAQNVNGSAAIHLDGDIYSVLAISAAITDLDLAATMKKLAL